MAKGKHYGAKMNKDEQVLENERLAYDLRVKGMSQMQIAERLGLTQQAISIILKRATKKYALHFLSDLAVSKHEQVVQLERVASEAMHAWYQSMENYEKTPNGDPRYLHEFRKAKEDIRKLLGMDLVEKELYEHDIVNRIQIELIGCEIKREEISPVQAKDSLEDPIN